MQITSLKFYRNKKKKKIIRIAKVMSPELLDDNIIKRPLKDEDFSKAYNLLVNNMEGSKLNEIRPSNNEFGLRASYSGQWEIHVWLHPHDWGMRDNIGEGLVLYAPDGVWYWNTKEILGRSASGDHPLKYKGNTPTGEYKGWRNGIRPNKRSYGTGEVISTIPVSGQIVDSGRSGIAIHGGSPSSNTSASWYPLRPTYGCVRVSNANQHVLADKIKELENNGAQKYGKIIMREIY